MRPTYTYTKNFLTFLVPLAAAFPSWVMGHALISNYIKLRYPYYLMVLKRRRDPKRENKHQPGLWVGKRGPSHCA